MTVFVDDATLRDAQDRAARLPLGSVEQQRWREVAAYGTARRPDPNPERAAVLRDLLSMPGADDGEVLDAAGRLLFLGGHGASHSKDGSRANTFANNDGWHDDVCDGPVTAEVKVDGRSIP